MQYEKIKYPDGQISVKRNNFTDSYIRMRINSYEDLFTVKSLASLCKPSQHKTLFIPCLFGQRSDRTFEENQSFDLKIICDFINTCGFERVTIFDPHSDVSLALINNSIKKSSLEYIQKTISDLADLLEKKDINICGTENVIFVSPDAGAYKKVFSYAEKLNFPIVAANKFRALDGKITLKFLGDVKGKDCLIIDDICDGGYTFYLLAKALREQGANHVYLYVSHMYASKGFTARLEESDPNSSLIKFLDGVYCTNSVKDISNDYYDGWHTKSLGNFITQYKII